MTEEEKDNVVGKIFREHKNAKNDLSCLQAQLTLMISNINSMMPLLKGEIGGTIQNGKFCVQKSPGSIIYGPQLEWPTAEKIDELIKGIAETTSKIDNLKDQLDKM